MQKNLHKKKNDAHGCNGTALRNVGNYDVFASEMLILNSYSIQNQNKNCFQKPNCFFIFSMETDVAGSGGALGMFSRGVFNVAVFVANFPIVFLVFVFSCISYILAGNRGCRQLWCIGMFWRGVFNLDSLQS